LWPGAAWMASRGRMSRFIWRILSARCNNNPLEPAALGSAILYGPRAGQHGVAFGRLGAARAARAIGSAADLAEALAELLSPDRAARLAQAAWTVTSDGAEATDQAMQVIRRLMDGEG
jgi:3-deoxy-D-manno-octulosonic-acid transferase